MASTAAASSDEAASITTEMLGPSAPPSPESSKGAWAQLTAPRFGGPSSSSPDPVEGRSVPEADDEGAGGDEEADDGASGSSSAPSGEGTGEEVAAEGGTSGSGSASPRCLFAKLEWRAQLRRDRDRAFKTTLNGSETIVARRAASEDDTAK